MTMEELVSKYRGFVDETKREEGERWRDAEINVRAEDLDAMLEEIELLIAEMKAAEP